MQAYQTAPCPYCGATWNPPGTQVCVNCRNQLPPPQAAYVPPGYAPGLQQGQPAGAPGQAPQAGYGYPPPGYPQQAQPGYPPNTPQYPGQPPQGYPQQAYPQQAYPQQDPAAAQGYPGYPPDPQYQQAGYPGAGPNPYAQYAPGGPGPAAASSANPLTIFGRQILLPFNLPAGLQGQRLKPVILAAAAVLALLVVFLGIVPAIASGQITSAGQAVSTAFDHQSKVDAAMAGFLKARPPGATPVAERALIDKELQTDQAALTLVQQDEAAIQGMDQRLAVFAWFALPRRQAILGERQRIATTLSGLKSADQTLTAFINQDRIAQLIIDVGQNYVTITTALGKRDLAGAGAPYPDAHQKIQDLLQLARASGTPPDMLKVVNNFNDLVENTEKLVQAFEAKDTAGIQKYSALYQSSAKALDRNAVTAWNTKNFQPLNDAYDKDLKSAKNS